MMRAGVDADAKVDRADVGADTGAPGVGRASAEQSKGEDRSD
jgi:hypothetical protein